MTVDIHDSGVSQPGGEEMLLLAFDGCAVPMQLSCRQHFAGSQCVVKQWALTIAKPVDKSSPLLGKAITDNELLSCEFSFYRTNRTGMNECYYKVKLTNARIASIHLRVPHTINDREGQAEESIELTYESINWEHTTAGTSAYSFWEERVF